MAVELKVPSFGESITEALVARWIKKEGEAVAQDEAVVVLETDKVTQELPAPAAGVLAKILVAEGRTVPIGTVLGAIEAGAGAPVAAPAAAASPAQAGPTSVAAPAPGSVPAAAPHAAGPAQAAPRVMPSAERVLAQAGLPASAATPTGPGGRVLKEDAQRAAAAPAPAAPTVTVPAAAAPSVTWPTALPGIAPAQAPVASGSRQEELVPMSPLRKKIAERLVQAKQVTALLTTFNEADMSAVMALRAQYKEAFEKKYGIKLGLMSFFVKAAIDALKLVPQVNAEVRGDAILYRNYYDIGVAVGGGRGLVVPVIRDADRLSFAEVERAIADYGRRAQENRLTLDELQGGTFTISNGGIYGSMLSTPILNFPQSGVLGLHNIQDRPVARDGQVVIRPMMYLALSYDHRIIDGREAVTFVKRIKECIENPTRLLLEV